jgi:hypothetical protein
MPLQETDFTFGMAMMPVLVLATDESTRMAQ